MEEKDEFDLWLETPFGKGALEQIAQFPQYNHLSALCRAYVAGRCAATIDTYKMINGEDMPSELLTMFQPETWE
mgnify:FL=1